MRADLLTHPPAPLPAVAAALIRRKAASLAFEAGDEPSNLAGNRALALALATEHAAEGDFLEVQMPSRDGYEFCMKIYKTVPKAKTPVAFVTGQSEFKSRARATRSGGNELVGKSVSDRRSHGQDAHGRARGAYNDERAAAILIAAAHALLRLVPAEELPQVRHLHQGHPLSSARI